MNSKGATLSIWLLLAGLVIACCQTVNATPPSRPEVEACDLYLNGNTPRGREVFRNVLADRMEELMRTPVTGRRSSSELVQVWTSSVIGSTHALVAWMRMEGWLRVNRGAQTPPDTIDTIADAATNLAVYAEALSASAEAMLTPQDKLAQAAMGRFNKEFRRLLYIALGFLRETGREGVRPDLFAVARHYRELPATLEEFDADFPNAAEIMEVHPEPPPPPNARLSPWTGVASDHPIATVAWSYYDAFNRGDIETLRSLMVEGYWPEEQILAAVKSNSGQTLLGIGKVQIRDIGNGEYEVWVTGIAELDAEGEPIGKRDGKFIVRTDSQRGAKISCGMSKYMRDVWQEGQSR